MLSSMQCDFANIFDVRIYTYNHINKDTAVSLGE